MTPKRVLQIAPFASVSTTHAIAEEEDAYVESSTIAKAWLVVGDGDLSYSAKIAAEMENSRIRFIASVLEDQQVHHRVYQHSKEHTDAILRSPSHDVRFGVDATNLEHFFPDLMFDRIDFNFPHWRGKTNAKYNRQLVNSFLESACAVLKPTGEIRMALCEGQGGIPSESLEDWRKSWMPSMYAAEHGLLLRRLESFEPTYNRSSHRGLDRGFWVGERPQRYIFTFPDYTPIDEGLQISCRHELRIMLQPDLLERSPVSETEIVHGDAVMELGKMFIPDGLRFEIAARARFEPLNASQIPLAVFLLNYSGASKPLTRQTADGIRAKIEAAIVDQWRLPIAKANRLVSRPYPYPLLPKLMKDYSHGYTAQGILLLKQDESD